MFTSTEFQSSLHIAIIDSVIGPKFDATMPLSYCRLAENSCLLSTLLLNMTLVNNTVYLTLVKSKKIKIKLSIFYSFQFLFSFQFQLQFFPLKIISVQFQFQFWKSFQFLFQYFQFFLNSFQFSFSFSKLKYHWRAEYWWWWWWIWKDAYAITYNITHYAIQCNSRNYAPFRI